MRFLEVRTGFLYLRKRSSSRHRRENLKFRSRMRRNTNFIRRAMGNGRAARVWRMFRIFQQVARVKGCGRVWGGMLNYKLGELWK
jgi:hypothetical protein